MQTVLLIEDDGKRALKINGYLNENGYSAVITETLEKALRIMARRVFAAIFIEMFMRTITGFEAASELRKLNADIPIVIFFGGSSDNSGGIISNENNIFLALGEKRSFELKKYDKPLKNKK